MVRLYKKIIILCVALMGISFVVSILSEFKINNSFIANYAIGIACSSFVVILTTLLQFRSERSHVEKEFISALNSLLSDLCFALVGIYDKGLNSKQYEFLYKKLKESIFKTHQLSEELCWFSWKKYKKCEKICDAVASIEAKFVFSSLTGYQEAVDNVATCDLFFPLMDSTLDFVRKGNYSQLFKIYKESIEKIQTSEESKMEEDGFDD